MAETKKEFSEEKPEDEEKPEFKTITAFEKKYGTRNFVEIALKKTEDSDNKFISFSKGYYDKMGNKRYKKSLGFTLSEEMKQFVIDSISKIE